MSTLKKICTLGMCDDDPTSTITIGDARAVVSGSWLLALLIRLVASRRTVAVVVIVHVFGLMLFGFAVAVWLYTCTIAFMLATVVAQNTLVSTSQLIIHRHGVLGSSTLFHDDFGGVKNKFFPMVRRGWVITTLCVTMSALATCAIPPMVYVDRLNASDPGSGVAIGVYLFIVNVIAAIGIVVNYDDVTDILLIAADNDLVIGPLRLTNITGQLHLLRLALLMIVFMVTRTGVVGG